MAGHDTNLNARVSLLTAQILEYWGVCQTKIAKAKARRSNIYVPHVQGNVIRLAETDPRSQRRTPQRKASFPWQDNDKAAATCLTQNLTVLSTRHEGPQWTPDETPDWALTGEDSPRCSLDSHISFEIETPSTYIHLSDLMAARTAETEAEAGSSDGSVSESSSVAASGSRRSSR